MININACHKIHKATSDENISQMPGARAPANFSENSAPSVANSLNASQVRQLDCCSVSPTGLGGFLSILLILLLCFLGGHDAWAHGDVKKESFYDFSYASKVWHDIDFAYEEWEKTWPFFEKYNGDESKAFPGKNLHRWPTNPAAEVIDLEEHGDKIKKGYDLNKLFIHWNDRFWAWLHHIRQTGVTFKEVDDPELCEILTDPLFGTPCNDFPDWRGDEDMEKLERAMKIGARNRAIREILESDDAAALLRTLQEVGEN